MAKGLGGATHWDPELLALATLSAARKQQACVQPPNSYLPPPATSAVHYPLLRTWGRRGGAAG